MGVRLEGPLQTELRDGAVCLWTAGGSIVWPAGSTVRVDPVRVLDAQGAVMASEGQGVVQGEGMQDDEPGCHPGTRRWVLTEVVPASSG